MKTKQELKKYFENGDIPVQEEFWEWLESYWHKDEKLTNNSLDLIAYDEFIHSPTDSTEIVGMGKKIIFPEGTKIIGSLSSGMNFSYGIGKNTLTTVIFPNSLEKIKSNAFSSQFLKGSLRIPGSCKVIENSAFSSSNCKITELILEEGIETIGSGAFQMYNNPNLTEIYIPDSVKSVGENAFNISSLTHVSALSGLDLSTAGIPATATITYR
jgi:hypothetical protein